MAGAPGASTDLAHEFVNSLIYPLGLGKRGRRIIQVYRLLIVIQSAPSSQQYMPVD